jgi:hypothetical protein
VNFVLRFPDFEKLRLPLRRQRKLATKIPAGSKPRRVQHHMIS